MAKTNIDSEFKILEEFDFKKSFNGDYIKRFFDRLTSVGHISNSPERETNFNRLFHVLDGIQNLKRKPEQMALKFYLQKIVRELETPSQQRLFFHHLSRRIKKFNLPELSAVGIDPEQLLSSTIHDEITKSPIELEPKRIIAFNKLDASNLEVLTSLKIAFARHRHEPVLITCSARDLATFGEKCETLVLIGHGSFYREGESSKGRIISKKDVQQSRKGNTLGLGPHYGKIDFLVSHLSDDLKRMPSIKHCRIVMCRAGAAEEKISPAQAILFEKKHANDPEVKSIMQVWDPLQPASIPYDENSLASAFWHKLFVDGEKWMTKDTDFALTVASSVINPVVPGENYAKGFFRVDDPENLKHANPLLFSKYITLATPASSKFKKRITENEHYSLVKK